MWLIDHAVALDAAVKGQGTAEALKLYGVVAWSHLTEKVANHDMDARVLIRHREGGKVGVTKRITGRIAETTIADIAHRSDLGNGISCSCSRAGVTKTAEPCADAAKGIAQNGRNKLNAVATA